MLRVLAELGAVSTFSKRDCDGMSPAYMAAMHGHVDVIRVIHELGASDSLSTPNNDGYTPAHVAAEHGHEEAIRVRILNLES